MRKQEKKIPAIVSRNRDIEHIMHASCRYGHHGYGEYNYKKLFAMLVTTDVHECPVPLHSAIEYLNYYDALDCGICLGDMQARNFVETDGTWYSDVIKQSEKEFYTVLGNHDVGNSKDVAISGTSQMAFEKFILPVADKIGVDGLKTPYYIKRFDKYKLAMLVLNNFETETLGADGNYLYSRGLESYSQTQIDWLINELQNIPQDYHIWIAMHTFPFEAETIPCTFSQPNKRITLSPHLPYAGAEIITDIVQAWIEGKPLVAEYEPKDSTLPKLRVRCDFTARGKGNFVCHLIGHYHMDIIARSKKYPNQKIVSLASTATDTWQNYGCDLARAEGTKAEDALTVFTVSPEERQIKLVRVGSNVTMSLTDRTCISIDY